MGNLIRTILLLLTIAAAVVGGVFRYQPRFLGRVDRKLQNLHKIGFDREYDAVKALSMPQGRGEAVSRLEAALADLEGTRLGDNRFPAWRSMTGLLASHYSELGDDVQVRDLLVGALQVDPNNLDFRPQLIRALIRMGGAEDMEHARANFAFLQKRFPRWSLVAHLEMELAIKGKDGAMMAQAYLRSRDQGRRELLNNWQVFLFPKDGAHTRTDLINAVLDNDGLLARAHFEVVVPEGGVARLRLDPPTGQRGTIRDWGVTLSDASGVELHRETGKWSSVVRTSVLDDGAMRLIGGKDPQWNLSLADPLQVNSKLHVELWFNPTAEVPQGLEAALQDSKIRSDFEAKLAELKDKGWKS